MIKAEENDGIKKLTDDLDDPPDAALETDNGENLKDLTAGKSPSNSDALDEDVILELDAPLTDDETEMEEDDLIASVVNDTLLLDEEEPSNKDDEFDFETSDDDDNVIIMDNEQDLADVSLPDTADEDASTAETDADVVIVNNAPLGEDEDLIAMEDDGASEAGSEENIFDLEEEIDLEYELDEDEEELIGLDDERAENQPDFADVVLGENAQTGRRDHTEEPAEFFNSASPREDNIMDMNEAEDETPPITAAMEPGSLKNYDTEDLPDLAAGPELDFENDDEPENVAGRFGEETDSGDEIIARTVRQSLRINAGTERFKPAGDAESKPNEDEDVIPLETDPQEDAPIVALEDDEPLHFEDDKGLLVDLEDVTELEDEDEIVPLDDSDDYYTEKEDDIVEITEFDQHYPSDSDKVLQQAGILDPTDEEEEDFLELIEVEENRQDEDEAEIIGTGDWDDKDEYTKLDNFFNEELEESSQPATDETAIKRFLPGDSVLTDKEAEDAEVAPEAAAANDASDSKADPFDFDFDPRAIARQVDGLDAFLSEDSIDEPEVASLPEDYSAAENAPPENLALEPDSEELPTFPPKQIEAAVERVINEKFSGRIENIIYEVIEKAVTKEIDRLRGVLLDSFPPDDNH
ncbi:MAG: hypothetical protein P8X90_27990 [Desulfobacterales bacterium]